MLVGRHVNDSQHPDERWYDISESREIGDQFWTRYKVSYPPHLEPADAGVSRLSREITKKLLIVRDVNKWRTMLHQVHARRNDAAARRRCGDKLGYS